MVWYRTFSRFTFDVFRRYNSKIVVAGNPISRTNPLTSSSIPNFTEKFSQPIFRNTALQNGLKQSFLNGAKRYYCVDRNGVHQLKRRGYRRWIENVITAVVICSGIVIIYFSHCETAPYTKRAQYMLLSIALEKEWGESKIKQFKSQFEGIILPPLHPDNIRVQRIFQDIIEALRKWSDISYSPESVMLHHGIETMNASTQCMGEEGKWHKNEEILDNKWVQQISRKTGEEKGKKSQTAHLEELNWEVLVVDLPVMRAYCEKGGKIVISTRVLQHYRADTEIATVILGMR